MLRVCGVRLLLLGLVTLWGTTGWGIISSLLGLAVSVEGQDFRRRSVHHSKRLGWSEWSLTEVVEALCCSYTEEARGQ